MTANRRFLRQLLGLACLGVASIQVYQFTAPAPIALKQFRVQTIAIDPEAEFEQQMGWK